MTNVDDPDDIETEEEFDFDPEADLLVFLRDPSTTAALIAEALELPSVALAEAVLALAARLGPALTSAHQLLEVNGLGPARLARIMAIAESRPLSEVPVVPVPLHPIERYPRLMQRIGEALIGGAGDPPPARLERAAARAAEAEPAEPRFEAVVHELMTAAAASEDGAPVPGFERTAALLQLPIGRPFLEAFEAPQRRDLTDLARRLDDIELALERLAAAMWIGSAGPERAADITLRSQFDEPLAAQVGALAPVSGRLVDAALVDAGLGFLAAANLLELHAPVLVAALLGCGDDCSPEGVRRDCDATDVIIVPKGRDFDDEKDFKRAMNFLKVFKLVSGKTISPAGKPMLNLLADNLPKLKKREDAKLVKLNGYGVFVRVTYEECVDGVCGNYWKEKSEVVEVDPPRNKRHLIGGNRGWRKSIIERLGTDRNETRRQFREFESLAEAKCAA